MSLKMLSAKMAYICPSLNVINVALTQCLFITTLVIYVNEGSVQNCSNSSALAMELLQSCTKPSIS